MLFAKQASVTSCAQLGASVAIGVTLSFGACKPPRPSLPPPPAPRPIIEARAVTPRASAKLPVVEVRPLPVRLQPPIDCAIEPCVALTFDDGPDPRATPQLLELLATHKVRATFFVLGQNVAKYPHLVQRISQDGHELGNHSWGHQDFTKLPPAYMLDEVARTQAALQNAGVDSARIFRPPYGARNDAVRQTVPLPLVLWNVDPTDWAEAEPLKIAAHLEAHTGPGAIILLHDLKPSTVQAVAHALPHLKQRYHLVTVSQLLNFPTEMPKGEFRHGPLAPTSTKLPTHLSRADIN